MSEDTEVDVEVHEDVTYATRDAGELGLDLFVPAVDDPPLVVYVHGGGWVFETRDNVPDPERYAAEFGCAIASVSYRLAEVPADVEAEMEMEIDPDNVPWYDELVTVQPTIENGQLLLPDGPGWGVAVNDEWLAASDYEKSEL
jgi:hypothetical protein